MNRITIAAAAFGALCVTGVLLFVLGLAVDAGVSGRSFRNVSEAMTPTLFAGEYFTERAIAPGAAGTLPRGALVTHRFPLDPSKQFVKRIIALAGDTIAMVDRRVWINGVVAPDSHAWYADTSADPAWDEFRWQERYLARPAGPSSTPYSPSQNNWGPLVVPSGSYFVLGDNRDNSLDSRFWGFVPAGDIVGVPRRVYFSFDRTSGRIRWNRLGYAVR
jgi:signal peptidase I